MTMIALVDNDPAVLKPATSLLAAAGYQTQTFADGALALAALKSDPPDLAIVDFKSSKMDGMEILRKLRLVSSLPVIFTSGSDEEIDEIVGLKMGADDFICKPFSASVLVERVTAILRRASKRPAAVTPATAESPSVFACGPLRLDTLRQTCFWNEARVPLTDTEYLMVKLLIERPGVVKSRDAFMDVAYGDLVYVDDRTIDSHIKRLRKKLRKFDPSDNAIETIYGAGYRLRVPPPTPSLAA